MTAFQNNAFQNDAFQVTGNAAVDPVDNPPVRYSAATLALIGAIWATPLAPQPVQSHTSIVPSLPAVVVDDQPARSQAALNTVLSSWQAKAHQQQPRRLLLVSVDDPPFGFRPQTRVVPVTWTGQNRTIIAAIVPADVADQPFVRAVHWLNQSPSWRHQSAAKLPPDLLAVPVDQPPVTSTTNLLAVVAQWPAPKALPVQAIKLPPQITAVPVDQPPVTSTTNLLAVVAQWPAPKALPVQAIKLPPQITAVPVDQPPVTRRSQPSWPAITWQAPASVKVAALIEPAPVDQPSVTRRSQPSWPAITWQAPASVKVAALIEPAPVDQPPVTRRSQPSWPAITWQAQTSARIAPLAESVVTPPVVEEDRGRGGWDPYAYKRRSTEQSVKDFYEQVLDKFIEAPTAKAEAAIAGFTQAAQKYETAVISDAPVNLTDTLFDQYQRQFNRVVKFIAPAKRQEFAAIVDTEEEELEFLLMVLDLD